MGRRHLIPVALVAAFALALAGCGGDDEPSAAPETGPGAATAVPEVTGSDLADAAETLADDGLRVAVQYLPSTEPAGAVFGQSPAAGTDLQRGESVRLSVSYGPTQPVLVRVPDAVDQTAADAEAALEQARFEVLTIPVPAVTEDTVVAHAPPAGAQAPRGSLVILYAGG